MDKNFEVSFSAQRRITLRISNCRRRRLQKTKGLRNNNFPEFAPRFGADWVDLREHNRKRSQSYAEDCASEDRPKLT